MNMIIIAALTLVTLILTTWYYLKVPIPRPPLGHFNWRDMIMAMFVIVFMPFIYLWTHSIIPTIVFGLVWLALLSTIVGPFTSRAFWIALVVVVMQGMFGWAWVGNIVTIVLAMGVGAMFIRNGLKSSELAAFAIVLMIYDIVATRFAGQMAELMEVLVAQPFFLGFTVGPGAMLGGGDVFLLAMFTADLARRSVTLAGIGCVLFSLPIVILAATGGFWADTGIPYLMIASPIYLLLLLITAVVGRRRLPGVADGQNQQG